VPFDGVLAGVFAAIASAFVLVGLLARGTSPPSRFISTGLLLIVGMLIALYPLWWGAAFATADYFADGRLVPIDQRLPIVGVVAFAAAVTLRVASRASRHKGAQEGPADRVRVLELLAAARPGSQITESGIVYPRGTQQVTVLIPAAAFRDLENDLAESASELWPEMTPERRVANPLDTHIDETLNTGGTSSIEAPTISLVHGGFKRI
jgi:hypothetical protein